MIKITVSLCIMALLLSSCTPTVQTNTQKVQSKTIERDLTHSPKDAKPHQKRHPRGLKPDFDITFEPGSATQLSEFDVKKLLADVPTTKTFLVLIGYAYGDQNVDPAGTAVERVHLVSTRFTLEGFDPDKIIPLTSWGQIPPEDIPNHHVVGFFIERPQLQQFLPRITLSQQE